MSAQEVRAHQEHRSLWNTCFHSLKTSQGYVMPLYPWLCVGDAPFCQTHNEDRRPLSSRLASSRYLLLQLLVEPKIRVYTARTAENPSIYSHVLNLSTLETRRAAQRQKQVLCNQLVCIKHGYCWEEQAARLCIVVQAVLTDTGDVGIGV